MEPTPPCPQPRRWPLLLILLTVVGTSLGFYAGRSGGPQRQSVQPLIDAFAKPIPAPPLGTFIRADDAGPGGALGPAKVGTDGPLSYHYSKSYYIDITEVSTWEAMDMIINHYANFYTAALGATWGGTGGGTGMRLVRHSDGSFDVGTDHLYLTRYKVAIDRDLYLESIVVDYPDDFAKTRGQPISVTDLSIPPNGRRVLWIRCIGSAHNVYRPANLP